MERNSRRRAGGNPWRGHNFFGKISWRFFEWRFFEILGKNLGAGCEDHEVGHEVACGDDHEPDGDVENCVFEFADAVFVLWVGEQSVALENYQHHDDEGSDSQDSIDDFVEEEKVAAQDGCADFGDVLGGLGDDGFALAVDSLDDFAGAEDDENREN